MQTSFLRTKTNQQWLEQLSPAEAPARVRDLATPDQQNDKPNEDHSISLTCSGFNFLLLAAFVFLGPRCFAINVAILHCFFLFSFFLKLSSACLAFMYSLMYFLLQALCFFMVNNRFILICYFFVCCCLLAALLCFLLWTHNEIQLDVQCK